MREIKFRAWDKDNHRMYYNNISKSENDGNCCNHFLFGFSLPRNQHYFNCELMQYTGLKDKNGKEIYEGDIIDLYHEEGDPFPEIEFIGKVTFSNGGFKLIDPSDRYPYELGVFELEEEAEVIGNVYENPELLENINEQ